LGDDDEPFSGHFQGVGHLDIPSENEDQDITGPEAIGRVDRTSRRRLELGANPPEHIETENPESFRAGIRLGKVASEQARLAGNAIRRQRVEFAHGGQTQGPDGLEHAADRLSTLDPRSIGRQIGVEQIPGIARGDQATPDLLGGEARGGDSLAQLGGEIRLGLEQRPDLIVARPLSRGHGRQGGGQENRREQDGSHLDSFALRGSGRHERDRRPPEIECRRGDGAGNEPSEDPVAGPGT